MEELLSGVIFYATIFKINIDQYLYIQISNFLFNLKAHVTFYSLRNYEVTILIRCRIIENVRILHINF